MLDRRSIQIRFGCWTEEQFRCEGEVISSEEEIWIKYEERSDVKRSLFSNEEKTISDVNDNIYED
ncbi:hypothetical protein F511_41940 [Dorcoceras hygrometricum]|uniref:Uncharacterized protein n=1 Tax=Dorcoceras hygrometricum TaxID=472368 RepID=A0A2Z7AG76_9LAMI|nr:hypothetical protein F511_41940 [Dorcoceras hygrometricum]